MSTSDLVQAADERREEQDGTRTGDGGQPAMTASQPANAPNQNGMQNGMNGADGATGAVASDRGQSESAPLLPDDQVGDFRSRWDTVQASFVDEPRHAVEQADALVADAISQLARVFAQERSRLEEQWSRGDQVSTDDLRFALQRYRSFFQRLLSI